MWAIIGLSVFAIAIVTAIVASVIHERRLDSQRRYSMQMGTKAANAIVDKYNSGIFTRASLRGDIDRFINIHDNRIDEEAWTKVNYVANQVGGALSVKRPAVYWVE